MEVGKQFDHIHDFCNSVIKCIGFACLRALVPKTNVTWTCHALRCQSLKVIQWTKGSHKRTWDHEQSYDCQEIS